MDLRRRMSRSRAQDLLSDARFVALPSIRARARADLAVAATADELLDVVNRVIPGGASQVAGEILAFVDLARRAKPRTLVEIGTEAGGTHLLLGHAVPSLEQTVAVDLRVRNRRWVVGLRRNGLEVAVVDGDSSSPATLHRVLAALGGREIDVLFIDGDHSFRGAMSDLLLYRPVVRRGGLIAFHDIGPRQLAAHRNRERRLRRRGAADLAAHPRDFAVREHVASWDQEGKGIGVLENDPDIPLRPLVERSSSRA